MVKKAAQQFLCFIFVFLATIPFARAGRELERDPIKDTQTDPVLVTPELLTRESESGPASPTFKMNDTSGFFAKKPYDAIKKLQQGIDNPNQEKNFSADDWKTWFKSEEDQVESTETLDEKELK